MKPFGAPAGPACSRSRSPARVVSPRQGLSHDTQGAGRSVAEILADPRTLPVDDIITRTEYALAGRFAAIATVAELAGTAVAVGG